MVARTATAEVRRSGRSARGTSGAFMKVFLVPASATRYALYCEARLSPDDGTEPEDTFFGRLRARFRRAVDEGEAAERDGADAQGQGRLRRLITRKLAEAVAEQRLLWRIRQEQAARLVHPDRLPGDRALAFAREEFERDHGRHRRWMLIDALIAAITGPLLFFVPGPNLVSWYFTFRAVGHYFSMRGASSALSRVQWTVEPTPHLTAIADALSQPRDVRAARIAAAAEALGLERLAPFVERVADQGT